MKKTITLLTLLLTLSAALPAQTITAKDSVILNKLITTNKQYRSIQNTFRHDLIKIKKKTIQHRYGTLYYQQVTPAKHGDTEAKIAMRYTQPQGEYYIITTTHLHNGIDGHNLHFNYRFVPLMKLLGNALAWAMNGDIYSIYNDLHTDFQLTSDAHHYIITLTVQKGYNKGITKMILKYDKTTCLIDYMEMEEKLGLIHKYTMGLDSKDKRHHPLLNTPINDQVYKID